jgi:uncharacterized protein YoaH (UPF0181 family)
MANNPQLKRELRQQDIERLRQLWDAGIASGSPVNWIWRNCAAKPARG